MDDYKLELEAVEAKLLEDPDNEALLSLRDDIKELLEMTDSTSQEITTNSQSSYGTTVKHSSDSNKLSKADRVSGSESDGNTKKDSISQEQILKRLEKLKKKKLKRKEKLREQHEIAEKEKQSWQSFANKKGLKGAVKKSIFASPHTVSGKVGVGTNGIADAPSASTSSNVDSRFRRRAMVSENDP